MIAMAKPGVFRLMVRDDRFDKLFTATEYLKKRLGDVFRARAGKTGADAQPTFADIEKTHILYLRSAYRPYVATACEYVKVAPSGQTKLVRGSRGVAEFVLPTSGSFTSDMALHVRFPAVGADPPPLASEGDCPQAVSIYHSNDCDCATNVIWNSE